MEVVHVVMEETVVVDMRVYTLVLDMEIQSSGKSDGYGGNGGGYRSGYGEAVVEDVRVDTIVVDTVEMKNMRIWDTKVEVLVVMDEEVVDTEEKGWLWMKKWWIKR